MQAITGLSAVCLYYIQTVRHGTVRTTRPFLGQSSTTGSGWISLQPPNGGSFDGVQSIKAALSGVG